MIDYSNNQVPYLIPINRTGRFSLDSTAVFYSIDELEAYVGNVENRIDSDGRCYPGQIVSVCTEDENGICKSDVYVIVGPKGEDGRESEGPFTYQKINATESLLEQEVTVRVEHVGAVKQGFKFNAGTSFTKFARIICGDYGYEKPIANVEYGDRKINGYFPYYEVGHILNCMTIGDFIQNDAGKLTRYSLFVNDLLVYRISSSDTGTGSITKNNMTYFINGATYDSQQYNNIIEDGKTIVLKSRFEYSEGEIKPGLEELEGTEDGHIKAGMIERVETLRGFRYSYCGTSTNANNIFDGNNVLNGINSAIIKQGNKLADIEAGDKFNISVKKGDSIIWFAYPARLGQPKKITSAAQFDAEMDNFNENIIVSMGSYSNYDPIDYNVQYYIPAIPYTGDDTITVYF